MPRGKAERGRNADKKKPVVLGKRRASLGLLFDSGESNPPLRGVVRAASIGGGGVCDPSTMMKVYRNDAVVSISGKTYPPTT